MGFSSTLAPAFDASLAFILLGLPQCGPALGQERGKYLATGLLNHIRDVILGIHDFAEFPTWFRFRNSRTWSYTLRGTLIEAKYFRRDIVPRDL